MQEYFCMFQGYGWVTRIINLPYYLNTDNSTKYMSYNTCDKKLKFIVIKLLVVTVTIQHLQGLNTSLCGINFIYLFML